MSAPRATITADAAAGAEGDRDLVPEQHVAVTDDGNGNGGGHFGDAFPVGRLAVPRFARTPVHREAAAPASTAAFATSR
jgi:hypothetical protein